MLRGLETDEIRALSNLFIRFVQSKPKCYFINSKNRITETQLIPQY